MEGRVEEDEDLWILEYWAPTPKSILAVYVKTDILKNHSKSLTIALYQYANVNWPLEHCLKYNKESLLKHFYRSMSLHMLSKQVNWSTFWIMTNCFLQSTQQLLLILCRKTLAWRLTLTGDLVLTSMVSMLSWSIIDDPGLRWGRHMFNIDCTKLLYNPNKQFIISNLYKVSKANHKVYKL